MVAGPIGNLSDLSPRAAETLKRASLWLVEDTRVSGKLQQHLGAQAPMAVLNDHTGAEKIATYLQRLKKGDDVALVSDAGTPVLSDPGAELVDAALDEGLEVEPIPGPSAVTASLSVSGFYGQRFAFLGFLPRKAGPARKVLAPFVESALTLVLFESPYRFRQTLEAVHQELGERRYAICRELTKLHEQVYRNTLPSLPSEAEVPAKGEFTLVIEGWRKPNADSRS